jgi:hypothetical protein
MTSGETSSSILKMWSSESARTTGMSRRSSERRPGSRAI